MKNRKDERAFVYSAIRPFDSTKIVYAPVEPKPNSKVLDKIIRKVSIKQVIDGYLDLLAEIERIASAGAAGNADIDGMLSELGAVLKLLEARLSEWKKSPGKGGSKKNKKPTAVIMYIVTAPREGPLKSPQLPDKEIGS